jgi:hypothetical protein
MDHAGRFFRHVLIGTCMGTLIARILRVNSFGIDRDAGTEYALASLFPTRLITTPVQVGSHGAQETDRCAPGLEQ